jgi:hypothetical protein
MRFKSILSSYSPLNSLIIKELNRRQIPVVYFYFDSQEGQTANKMMKSLLNQLLSQLDELPPCLTELLKQFSPKTPHPDPALSTLVDLFVTSSKDVPSLRVMLDGFDECDRPMRENLLKSVICRCYQSGTRVGITTQSWLLSDLSKVVPETPCLQISADSRDVGEYFEANMRDGIKDELKTEIVRTITSGVGGM